MKAIKTQRYFVLFLVLVSCSTFGQVTTKRNVTEHDYGLWSTMEIQGVASDGDWVSYHLSYESGNDTLYVRNSARNKTHAFPKGTQGVFASSGWFGCMVSGKLLRVLHLQSGKKREFTDVQQFAFSSDGGTLLCLNGSKQLVIARLDSKDFERIENVSGFYMNPLGTGMVYTLVKEKASLHYTPLDGVREHYRKLLSDGEATFENIIWQSNGASFTCIRNYRKTSDFRQGKNLILYRLLSDSVFELDATSSTEIEAKSFIVAPQFTRFRISDDGKRVFFMITEPTAIQTEKSVVQIWNGNDPWTYSQLQREGDPAKMNRYAVWFPDENKVTRMTSADDTKIILSGNQQHAITFNPTGKSMQYGTTSETDWYVTDLQTGKKTMFLEDQRTILYQITPSFGGKYVAYFRDQHWFIYDFSTGTHRNVSAGIPHPVVDADHDYPGLKPAFGIMGWTADDRAILLYDQYDLWKVSLDDFKTERLTKGREQDIVFRHAMSLQHITQSPNFDGFTFPLVDLEKGFYLTARERNTHQSGYYHWKNREKKISFSTKAHTQLAFSEKSDVVFFSEEDFNMPRRILRGKVGEDTSSLVFQSNTHHGLFHWGTSKLITYTNSKGTALQGALFYPADYDAKKKYPMVVYIYEKLSDHVHNYVNPTLYNGGELNISVMTAKGYLVLYPDIDYTDNEVGFNATDCTLSATKAVIAMGIVDENHIGLMGHSFGGYEVAFIATQTDVFATIIVGAGVSDLMGSYLSVGWNSGKPEFWRYEDHQWRMKQSLYDNMEVYLRNSPIMHAQQVNVPLLIWTGELDRQVHYYQSIAFYNALRRMGKKEIMLIYPENRHRLTVKDSQVDFTRRYEQWFDAHLKHVPQPDWMRNGLK